MKWTVLVDNRTNDPALETEHGLSILLETERHRILLDTGASDMFIRNAERLGIDLCAVDYVFISHGHSDHAGGLKHFMGINDKAKVIVSPHAMSGKFFSKRLSLHSITSEWPEIPRERLLVVNQSGEIADGLYVIANISHTHPMPKGNQHLLVQMPDGEYILDDFRHELALYTEGFLFTGCAHSGLENILSACPFAVKTVVGGFHLLDHHETEDELKHLADRLMRQYPEAAFHTSHCTGDNVFQTLTRVMAGHLHAFSCGTKLKKNMNNELENILSNIQQKEASVLCQEVTSIGDTMDVLRAKWNVEILTAILCGQTRFKDMLTSVKNISEKVLADRLKQLADDKLIEKQECYGYPPRVEYRLTEHGKRLYGIVYQMTEWGVEHRRLMLG